MSALAKVTVHTVSEAEMEALANAKHHKKIADTELARALAGDCTMCGQPYPADLEVAKTVEALAAKDLAKCVAAVNGSNALYLEQKTKIGEEYQKRADELHWSKETLRNEQSAQVKAAAYENALALHNRNCSRAREQFETQLAAWSTKASVLREKAQNFEAEAVELEFDLRPAIVRQRELEVCEQVLGVRGVRVVVLTHALAAAESLANVYLGQMSIGMRVKIRGFTTLKNGDVNANISIEVEGAGAGHGYKASSGGERRRIDAALLLAFAEIAAAASGGDPGTLFIDEVFDALDVEGCASVAQVLADLGQRRCVVLITHRVELTQLLKRAGAKVYTAVAGKITPGSAM
jgi:DNA repair exonuclease SbcCD ATPase subunit